MTSSQRFEFNHDSLLRHDVTEHEIKQAIADPFVIDVEEGFSKSGFPRVMWVGYTESGRLLEVGIEYKENCDFVYHADNAQAKYRQLYHQPGRQF